MNLADVFTVLFVILGFVITFICYWLMSAGLYPAFVERSAEQFGRRPYRTALMGAITLIPLLIVGTILSKVPNGGVKLLGLLVLLLPILAALFGSAGIALRIGHGLKSARDEAEPWRRTLRGGVVLGLAFVMPVIGWFVVMPLTFIAGFGAYLSVRREPQALATPPPLPTVNSMAGTV